MNQEVERDKVEAQVRATNGGQIPPVTKWRVLPPKAKRRRRVAVCRRCQHSQSFQPGTEVVNGLCGWCADDLRNEAQALEAEAAAKS